MNQVLEIRLFIILFNKTYSNLIKVRFQVHELAEGKYNISTKERNTYTKEETNLLGKIYKGEIRISDAIPVANIDNLYRK